MTSFVHELISHSAERSPSAIALKTKHNQISYTQLNDNINSVAQSYHSLGIVQGDRIGVYLAKNQENVQSMFACSLIAAVFVPINPVLKPRQVQYLANDCQIKLLITNSARLKALQPNLTEFTSLETIIVIDSDEQQLSDMSQHNFYSWDSFLLLGNNKTHSNIHLEISENDLAAILYTSGSTGQPKGIMLSHKNIVLGAKSVAQYLSLDTKDNILCVLPLSFDYGLNQLTSSFLVAAKCVLLDYLLAKDVIKAIAKYQITGLAAVPPLWQQLCKVTWSENCADSVRYFTNSGGVLPLSTLATLRDKMPKAKPFLMYGLTEAFRSSYLSPSEIDQRPSSMGKAIPHAEILVLREDGSLCDNDEVGELVHVGPLVTLGYWQNKAATHERFRVTPAQANNLEKSPLAVYSGDYVKRDKDGFLYFVSRKDAMIKTSGYRVSPTEVESVLLSLPQVDEAVVIPSPSTELGQSITAVIISSAKATQAILAKDLEKIIIRHCQINLPNYMIPRDIKFLTSLPKNANGKLDTKALHLKYNKEIDLT